MSLPLGWFGSSLAACRSAPFRGRGERWPRSWRAASWASPRRPLSRFPPDPPKIVQTRAALGRLAVRAQSAVRRCDRREFGSGFTSSGGCRTNEAVLFRDGLDARKGPGCRVSATHWRSVYDDVTLTSRSGVQIDHIVALANAWRSGASRWSREDRVRFANDLHDPELIAVSATSNRIKSDQAPRTGSRADRCGVCTRDGGSTSRRSGASRSRAQRSERCARCSPVADRSARRAVARVPPPGRGSRPRRPIGARR